MVSLAERFRDWPKIGFFESAARRHSREIDAQLYEERKVQQKLIKTLVLGSSGSGKSTIVKQLKIAYADGFSNNEANCYRYVIYHNLITEMLSLCDAMRELGEKYLQPASLSCELVLRNTRGVASISTDIFSSIKTLLQDETIQKIQNSAVFRTQFDFDEYFLLHLDRISAKDYGPTNEDILHSRMLTNGVEELAFEVKEIMWRVIDIGMNRSQRKWIRCFEDFTAVIFVIALSEYNQPSTRNEHGNRLTDSLAFFNVCNNVYFRTSEMILFLNKRDIFEKKLALTALSEKFEEYNGDNSFPSSVAFIENLVLDLNSDNDRKIYTHIACATQVSDEVANFTYESVIDGIISMNMREARMQ